MLLSRCVGRVRWPVIALSIMACSGGACPLQLCSQPSQQNAVIAGRPVFVLQTGHSDWVTDLAFNPSSRLIASSSVDQTVKLLDATSGALRATLHGHKGAVNAVAWHTEGLFLASASADETLRVWDVRTAEELKTLYGHKGAIVSVDVSPDGASMASAGEDGTIRLWDAKTYAVRWTIEAGKERIAKVLFSRDSASIIATVGKSIKR